MRPKGVVQLAIPIVLALVVLVGIGYWVYKNSQAKSIPFQNQFSQPTPTPDPTANWKGYTFQSLQLSLKVPADLTVHTEEQNPGSFSAYIQNYPFNAPYPEKNAYQLYITWQQNISVIPEEFQQLKNDIDKKTIEDTTIDIYPAIKGQFRGERNRFITYILKDKTLISLFTADPTEKNRDLTDQILSTFNFVDN